jgi:ribosomal protein S27E
MAGKNRFKFRCLDCKAETIIAKIELSRASRPRCAACGSIALEPVTDLAKERIVHGHDAAQDQAANIERLMGKPRPMPN